MREKLGVIVFLGFLFLSTTGATVSDKEGKESKPGVVDISEKIGQLQEQGKNYHFQESKQLTETINQLQVTTSQLNDVLKELKELKTSVANLKLTLTSQPPHSPQPPPPVDPTIQPVSISPPPPVAAEPPPPQLLPVPHITVSVPEDLKLQIKNARYQSLIGIIFSCFSILSIIFVLVYHQKGQDKIRQMLWKAEVDNLRGEVVQKRPLLKIQSHGDILALVNSGDASADEIRVFLGTAPTTMKQKLKTPTKIDAGEKMPLDLPVTLKDEPLYATLEYKNSHSGRIYKDQFILKSDSLTGQTVSQHSM